MTKTLTVEIPDPAPTPAPEPAPTPDPAILELAERAGAALTAAEMATARVAELEALLQEVQRQQEELRAAVGLAATAELLTALEERVALLEATDGAVPGVEPVVPDGMPPEPEPEPAPDAPAPKPPRGAMHRLLFGA